MPSTFFDNWTDGQSVRRGRIVRGRIVPSRRQTINYTVTTRLDVSHNFNNCGRQGQLPHRSGHGSAGPKMEKGEWRCKSYYVHVCQNVAKQYSLPLTSGIWLVPFASIKAEGDIKILSLDVCEELWRTTYIHSTSWYKELSQLIFFPKVGEHQLTKSLENRQILHILRLRFFLTIRRCFIIIWHSPCLKQHL